MVQTGAESKWLKGTAGRGSLNSHVGNRISRAGTAEVRQKETSRRREALSRVIERDTTRGQGTQQKPVSRGEGETESLVLLILGLRYR